MHVITLNGKPVTVRMLAIHAKRKDVAEYPRLYIVGVEAKIAKNDYITWFEEEGHLFLWQDRPKGIECRRLTKEDVV